MGDEVKNKGMGMGFKDKKGGQGGEKAGECFDPLSLPDVINNS